MRGSGAQSEVKIDHRTEEGRGDIVDRVWPKYGHVTVRLKSHKSSDSVSKSTKC